MAKRKKKTEEWAVPSSGTIRNLYVRHLAAPDQAAVYTVRVRKNPGAVALAKRRAQSLTPAQRSAIARKAARARWAKP